MQLPGRHVGLFLSVGMTVWLGAGVPGLLDTLPIGATQPNAGTPTLWLLPYGLFAVAMLVAALGRSRSRPLQLALIGVEAATAIAVAETLDCGLYASLLVPVALHAAMVMRTAPALAVVALQSIILRASLFAVPGLSCWLAWGLGVACQVIAVGAVHVLRQEAETGDALRRVNAELQAAQRLLATRAATAERTRISRELHDAWGHELTALNLQLEYAVHASDEMARASVLEARGTAKALLAQVRDVVGTLRTDDGRDLRESLVALAARAPLLQVHFDLPENLRPQSAETTQAIIRSAQEIITNTLRHATARNLWLSLREGSGGIELGSRDDGNGAERLRLGNGLNGLRERFELLGGRMNFTTARGAGFHVVGWIPTRQSSP